MRTVNRETIVSAVADMCVQAACELPAEIMAEMKKAAAQETSERGRAILARCIENAHIASRNETPMCQDTGIAVFFVELGSDVHISGGTLEEAIQEGTERGYRDGYLRKSIVSDPVFDRHNTGTNTPAIVHLDTVAGDTLSITMAPKGAGCENMSALAMLKPGDGAERVADFVVSSVIEAGGNPCPPCIVGVGIGGAFETAALLSKKALFRSPPGSHHTDPRYAELEATLLSRINDSGVGPQGLGGRATALAVHIETFPCHIASLPVAVNLNCHAARHVRIQL